MLQKMIDSGFSQDSRVWVFQAESPFDSEFLDRGLVSFSEKWTSHDRSVNCLWHMIESRVLVVLVDETYNKVSGCGIDKLTHFIQDVSDVLEVDLLNRSGFYEVNKSEFTFHSLKNIGDLVKEERISLETPIVDFSVSTLSQLEKGVIRPISETWLAGRYF